MGTECRTTILGWLSLATDGCDGATDSVYSFRSMKCVARSPVMDSAHA